MTVDSKVEKKDAPKDPTIRTDAPAEPAEGAHELAPLSEQYWSAENKEYRDMPEDMKPDPTTVAQVEVRPDEK
jgi:hypothetical protein